jgi:predicted NUDIX family phosphoesterase
MQELVYCVRTKDLPLPQEAVLPLDKAEYDRLLKVGEFRLRDEVEVDPQWRQIIPYAVVTRWDQVLLVERLRAGSEARLHDQLSIGLGGHINPSDHPNARDLFEGGLARELREELYIGAYFSKALGLIHSDEGPVSQVHTGLLYRIRTLGDVRVRETKKLAGRLVGSDVVGNQLGRLEGWSRLAFDFLYNS